MAGERDVLAEALWEIGTETNDMQLRVTHLLGALAARGYTLSRSEPLPREALDVGRDIIRQLTEWAGRYGGLPQSLQDRADLWRLDVDAALSPDRPTPP